MLDRHNRRHAVSRIRSCKFCIFFLQDSQLFRIAVDHLGKTRLKARQMRAALLCENIVAEAKYIFLKCIDKLERHFNLDLVADALKINWIMNRRLRAVQLAHIRHDAVRLRISHLFSLACPLILIKNRQLRVQICRLMQAALEPVRLEPRFFKNLRIRQKIDLCSGLSCLSNHRQKTIDQFNRRDAALICIVMDLSILIYIDLQMR